MEWDDDTLRRFREGTPEVLAEVYRAHAEPFARLLKSAAWRGAFTRLRNAMELENTLLETFARAFEPRTRAAYNGTRPYAHFLMGIARNVLLEQSRERELVGRDEPFEGLTESSPEDGGLAELLEDREVEALLAAFKDGLSRQEQRLFELRFSEGVAQEEAATALGLTRIQVRRREFGLKSRLLGFLQSKGYLEDLETQGWSFFKRRSAR
ncbi:RNA polymerase sigma factor [Corallococcus aberystwythensis]|uniref:Sigma-70 family RNA polymerase sigma factor n=1 Tax=Corallococcus aberystwythensis TaxID=2316722 RepID=A0A3A8QSD3_9BACT|nr:sigma-70 family RNA polymerase sigma factor [Corallococcus aberystwythensis]RKH71447.1 sigma-70 family RNA polymerase sigma factor [Corallococcus aberystwythensis]